MGPRGPGALGPRYYYQGLGAHGPWGPGALGPRYYYLLPCTFYLVPKFRETLKILVSATWINLSVSTTGLAGGVFLNRF